MQTNESKAVILVCKIKPKFTTNENESTVILVKLPASINPTLNDFSDFNQISKQINFLSFFLFIYF